jgi:hypothetical protein
MPSRLKYASALACLATAVFFGCNGTARGEGEGEGEGETFEGEGEDSLLEEIVLIDLEDGAATLTPLLPTPQGPLGAGDAGPLTLYEVNGQVIALVVNGIDLFVVTDALGTPAITLITDIARSGNDTFSLGSAAAADLDDDGDADLVVVSGSPKPVVVIEQELGAFLEPTVVQTIAPTDNPPVGIGCEGNGDIITSCSLGLNAVVLEDIDADGDLDIIAAGTSAGVWLNDGDANFSAGPLLPQIDVTQGAANVARLVSAGEGLFGGVGSYSVTRQGAHGDTSIVMLDVSADAITVAASFRALGPPLLQPAGDGGWLVCDGDVVHLDENLSDAVVAASPGCGTALIDLDSDGQLELFRDENGDEILRVADGTLSGPLALPDDTHAGVAVTLPDSDVVIGALRTVFPVP